MTTDIINIINNDKQLTEIFSHSNDGSFVTITNENLSVIISNFDEIDRAISGVRSAYKG